MAVLPIAQFADQFGQKIISGLAVVGAAGLGYGLVVGLFWAICKFVIHVKPPAQLAKALGVIGALAAGIAAAMLLFSSGPGGGNGWGLGDRLGFGSGSLQPTNTAPTPVSTAPQVTRNETESGRPKKDHEIEIVMVGGSKLKDKKFYRLEGQAEAVDIENLETLLRPMAKPPKTSILIVFTPLYESVHADHKAVDSLIDLALRLKLGHSTKDESKK